MTTTIGTNISTGTSSFYERSTLDMTALRKRAEALQTSLATGDRLTRSSHDPVAAARLRTLARADAFATVDTGNASRASSDLGLADTALSSFANYVIRAKELAIQAANETLSPAQRAGIGIEIGAIRNNLVQLANSRDSGGNALFGGQSAGDAYAVDAAGTPIYTGTAASGTVPLGDGQVVGRGLTGPEFLNFPMNGAPTDLMTMLTDLADALQGGVPDPAGAARDALTGLDKGLESITTAQTVVGSRLAWVDFTNDRRIDISEMRETEEAEVGGTDIAAAVTQLQQAMTVLEASQASFAKLSGLSLFDVLR